MHLDFIQLTLCPQLLQAQEHLMTEEIIKEPGSLHIVWVGLVLSFKEIHIFFWQNQLLISYLKLYWWLSKSDKIEKAQTSGWAQVGWAEEQSGSSFYDSPLIREVKTKIWLVDIEKASCSQLFFPLTTASLTTDRQLQLCSPSCTMLLIHVLHHHMQHEFVSNPGT